jgi:hypothetical protein
MHLNKGHYDAKNDRYVGIMYNNTTQQYSVISKQKPETPAYIAKVAPKYIREYIKAEDATKVFVPYRNREYHLADILGLSNFKEDVQNKKYIKEMVYLDPRLYGADFNITDTYLKEFIKKYGKDSDGYENIHQAYLDIETDVIMAPGDNDRQAIYMIATYDEKTNTMNLDYLECDRYKNQKELEDPNWVQKVKDNFIKEVLITPKMNSKKMLGIRDAFIDVIKTSQYVITKFKDELQMIKEAWQRIFRKNKPNYLQIYNADYDVSQCYRRYIYLGGDPTDLFTNPEIGNYYDLHCKTIRKINGTYRPPREKKFHPMNEPQWYSTDSYTSIQDTQVIHYGLRVKEEDSYSLEATASRELGFGKLDYTKTAQSVFHLPYVDFALTAEYNIRDTMVLKAMEIATSNMLANIIKRNMMATEWDRLFVSKSYCTNTFDLRGQENGIIQRNEINAYLNKMPRSFYENLPNKLLLNLYDAINKEEDMAGGFVANPNKLRAKGPEFIEGVPNYKRQKKAIDIDAEAHYPSAIISNNIGLESLWNEIKYIVYEDSEGNAHRIDDPTFIAMKLINRDIVGIGELFGLPSLEELTEMSYGIECDWKEYEEKKGTQFRLSPLGLKAKTVLRNIFNDKLNQIDKNAEMHSMSNHFSLSIGEDVFHSYYGSLISYHFERENTRINTLYEFIENYHFEKKVVFGKIVKDEVAAEVFEEVVNDDFVRYNTPKNVVNIDEMRVIETGYMSETDILELSKARDYIFRYTLGNYHIDLTNRLFASPNPKAEIKVLLLENPSNKDILFMFDSRLNIKIDKTNNMDLVLRQVFSILPEVSN